MLEVSCDDSHPSGAHQNGAGAANRPVDLGTGGPIAPDLAAQETEIFKLSPVARAFPGQILLGLINPKVFRVSSGKEVTLKEWPTMVKPFFKK